ncbi:MAG TPA: SDR family NAD(P)-dependent oxidoreductase [Chitinophagaceae bacterium]|nr:SDR family NAD(P)-dependent oxidoreductase [Chitinophagaceae bacterium]
MKTIIITGVSGNLGQAVAKKFLSEGFNVIGTVIPNDPAKLNIAHVNFETITVDLMSEEEGEKFVQSVIEKYKAIDAAVLTVGGFAMGTIAETKMTDMLKQYKLNFETTYHVARPVFVQMMKQNNGRIFLTGARTGIDMKNSKGTTAYGLSKSLIFRLAELMNEEAKGHNVITSVIAPSIIDTPQNRQSMPNADPAKWVKAEDIASVLHFYCSAEALALREPLLKFYNNA